MLQPNHPSFLTSLLLLFPELISKLVFNETTKVNNLVGFETPTSVSFTRNNSKSNQDHTKVSIPPLVNSIALSPAVERILFLSSLKQVSSSHRMENKVKDQGDRKNRW